MKVTVIAVGRARGLLAPAIAEYEARAARYWKLEVVEVDAGSGRGDAAPEDVRRAEAERILARIPAGADVTAMTRGGKGMSSRMLASHLSSLALVSSPGAAFVLGGAWGLERGVLDKARRKLSLSPMTLPHEMARLVLAEQLYRAGTIHRNEPYHKEGS
jgi:23S rRNA (pseudouridine1915-N3)-methyltransferase